MNTTLFIIRIILEEGFIYAILALGVYITFTVLDFPDMTVDGTVPLGALVTGVLILHGFNPWLCCLLAFAAGAVAGSVTGLLHVKLKIEPLLCGILVMTALLSVNFVVAMKGTGSSLASFYNLPNIFTAFPASLVPEQIGNFRLRVIVLSFVLAVLCKVLLDAYLKTKSGLLLRATGNNAQFVTMLARNPGNSKILGLAIGNGFAGLAGSVIAQAKQSADVQMGTGMVVLGLASVIIGISMLRDIRFMAPTTMVIVGSILYKACLQIALSLGLPQAYLKLLMAVLFVLALVFSNKMDSTRKRGKGGFIHAKV